MFNRKGNAMNDRNRKEFPKNNDSHWRPQEALRYNISFFSVGWISLVLSGLFLSSASGAPTVSTNRGPYAGGNTIVISNIEPGSVMATNVIVCDVRATISTTNADWVRIRLGPYGSGLGNIVIQFASMAPTVLTNAYTYNPPGVIGEPILSGWEEVKVLPTARYGLATATLGNYMYAIGGLDGSKVLTNVYRYDGRMNWVEVEGLPAARYNLAAAALSNRLYAIGGWGDVGIRTNVYRFDGTNWSQVPGLPAGRQGLAAAMLGTNLYAIGGWGDGAPRTNVYRYSEGATNWVDVAGLPAGREGLAAATLGNDLYAIGGRGDGAPRTNVYRYSEGATNWVDVAGLPAGREGLAAATLGTNLYAIGGWDGTNVQTSVYRYDKTTWMEVTNLPAPRYALAAATLNNNLYAIMGRDGYGVWTNVYRSIDTGGVSPTNGQWDSETEVTISGVNLGDGDITNVTLCDISAQSIVTQSATQVVVKMRPALMKQGLGDVRVYSVSYGETVKSNAFYYGAINLALASRGSTITGITGENWSNLIDGVTTGYTPI